MIYIYKSDVKAVRKYSDVNILLHKLPKVMHKRANRYKFEEDAFNFILGRLLLKRGLSDLKIDAGLEEIKTHKSGKPFLGQIKFNISHSDGLVVCALSTEGEVGIDLEKVKQVKLEDFETFFTKTEWINIHSATSPLQRFYWYWTRKESIIKAMRVKLSHLHKIELDASMDWFMEKEKKWYLMNVDFGNEYKGAICSESPIKTIKHINVDHLDFFKK